MPGFKVTVAGLTHSGEDIRQLAQLWRKLAASERSMAGRQTSQRETRFHEGKARAFEQCAETMEAIELLE